MPEGDENVISARAVERDSRFSVNKRSFAQVLGARNKSRAHFIAPDQIVRHDVFYSAHCPLR
jgi:hypothetical protein